MSAWAVSTVFLADTEAARAVLAADPRLAGHVWALDLATVERAPTVAAGFDGRLLLVRSPGRARDAALLPAAFDWSGLKGGLAARLGFVRPSLPGAASRLAPADAQLRWLEDLAARVAGTVAWYQAESTGGEPDAELAWVIDWRGPGVVDGEPVDRAPCVYVRGDRGPRRIDTGGTHPVAREPLGAALLHLGVRLDGPWFTPHRPDFNWGPPLA